jgi:hypothetical protein
MGVDRFDCLYDYRYAGLRAEFAEPFMEMCRYIFSERWIDISNLLVYYPDISEELPEMASKTRTRDRTYEPSLIKKKRLEMQKGRYEF